MSRLVSIITATDPAQRNLPLDRACAGLDRGALLAECAALDQFRRQCPNLYERVRALFFLYAIHRFHLPTRPGVPAVGRIPYQGYELLLARRFDEAILAFAAAQAEQGPSDALSSALATAYRALGFQTLADQVRRSVRALPGNHWMFRTGHPADFGLQVRPELLQRIDGLYPLLHESTPVRMDLSHSGWSDIFFLGMDYPEGARVVNISVDLSVWTEDDRAESDGTATQSTGPAPGVIAAAAPTGPRPPVEAFFRVIDEPILRLASVDLEEAAEVTSLAEVFDFARDHLGLLKGAVIAAGLVPPGMEGSGQPLPELLERLVGPGRGIELVAQVNRIPKGSRLAVSTSLLASLIAVSMRATGQIRQLTGSLTEADRRLVAARAILGEWLAGSGGGWQDSGGVWPGVKLIYGVAAAPGDPEHGVSRGRLLPSHRVFTDAEVTPATRQALQDSLVLVHGGMAQNVGPILEMVTEKYLLRAEAEWAARQQAVHLLDQVLACLTAGDTQALGQVTDANFHGPIQAIVPWTTNRFTETLIERVRTQFGRDFWGFWMLGGMAGGGMGFLFAPQAKPRARAWLAQAMRQAKRELQDAVPFAMDPVVYDFRINETGTAAQLHAGGQALLPPGYYTLVVPGLLRQAQLRLSPARRAELDRFGSACRTDPALASLVPALFDRLLPAQADTGGPHQDLTSRLNQYGFDRQAHEQIRADLRSGRIGLAQNRLPATTRIEDVRPGDVRDASHGVEQRLQHLGQEALAAGEVAVVTLAGGVGSRWTQGAGVVKALSPFCRLGGRHRTFLEVHLAKSQQTGRRAGCWLPHVVTTSYLTEAAVRAFLAAEGQYGYPGPLVLSPDRHVGLRLTPTARDLRFAWEELPQQQLDERAQKVRQSLHQALLGWAQQQGEASDYTDNLPHQCLHPVGHWYEVPNLLSNGVLAELLSQRPQLRTLLVHNIDTVGTDVDPGLLGLHLDNGAALTFEVIPRRLDDRGGGLARVDGHLRLVEGLALPSEELEFGLSYYNTLTTWVDIDQLLAAFGLSRASLADQAQAAHAVRHLASQMPTYVTLKEVKKRWGRGQEDVYPVAQFEKLWGDMTARAEILCAFACVARDRGQQLKDVGQLDGWLRDGSAAYVEGVCGWG